MGLIRRIRKNRRAISPVIATIIIVAITIAISVAVAGWMMGLWGGLTRVEALKITPTSLKTDRSYSLLVTNSGSAIANITKITIGGVDVTSPSPALPFIIAVGDQTTISGTAALATVTAGRTYDIHVYTAAGNDYLSQIVAS